MFTRTSHAIPSNLFASFDTKIKGQIGYKEDGVLDKMSDAENMYKEFMWIIK